MSLRKKAISGALETLQKTGLGRVLAPVTRGCGAIFMLHSVRPARTDSFQPNQHLEVTPEFLRVAVERIRANGYEIISLDEAVDLLKSGYGKQRYAVLTFDDGYRDNLEVAYPVLKELQAPFTVYVATGLVDRTSELWWVALERIIAENDEIVFTPAGTGSGMSCPDTASKNLCYEKMVNFLTLELSEADQRAVIRALSENTALTWKRLPRIRS